MIQQIKIETFHWPDYIFEGYWEGLESFEHRINKLLTEGWKVLNSFALVKGNGSDLMIILVREVEQ